MYQIGDLICYGKTGVCKITDIGRRSCPGGVKERLYYTLKPLNQEFMIYTPVDNDKVFMRSIISREEAERLIDEIPSVMAEPYHNKVISQLTEHYQGQLNTYDCADLIQLTMSIYAKKREVTEQNRKFGAVDEKFMKYAEDLLFGELSAALDIEKDEVPGYIASRVDNIDWEGLN